ncbi:hypothetical protein BURMUCF2_1386 [Burkholderia multivorans CF2]|nr:hypothetical protein BURMUCF2_1386 [Burkholderia multivorans CF2]
MSDVHESVDAVMRIATAPLRSGPRWRSDDTNRSILAHASCVPTPAASRTRFSQSACTRSGYSL